MIGRMEYQDLFRIKFKTSQRSLVTKVAWTQLWILTVPFLSNVGIAVIFSFFLKSLSGSFQLFYREKNGQEKYLQGFTRFA